MLGALAEAAGTADHAASFMFDNPAAVRAGALGEDAFFVMDFPAVGRHMGLNRLGHRVRTGHDLVFAEAGGGMAGNSL